MKKEYTSPDVEVILFDKDLLTEPGGNTSMGTLPEE